MDLSRELRGRGWVRAVPTVTRVEEITPVSSRSRERS